MNKHPQKTQSSSDTWFDLDDVTFFSHIEKETGLSLTGLCLKRNSYINRVFEVEEKTSKERLVIKFYRPGRWTPDMIRSEHQILAQLKETDIPVVVPETYNKETLFFLNKKIPFACFPRYGGRSIDEFSEDQWVQVGRIIGRLHLALASVTDISRDLWHPQVVTAQHLEVLKNTKMIPGNMQDDLYKKINDFIDYASPIMDKHTPQPIHGDCHKGNFIFRPDEGIRLIDFDDMVIGPPVQDIWMLLPDEIAECRKEINLIAEGYEIYRPFPDNEIHLVPILQVMRQIHFAAWCALQKEDAHFEETFAYMTDVLYWQDVQRSLTNLLSPI
jgi:Ser/Thr protein kinase RdoA (MazF antagonist)